MQPCQLLHVIHHNTCVHARISQATKNAVGFYEKLGFVRVGAVAAISDTHDMPVVAYRHWIPNPSRNRVHAEPSIMMCMDLRKIAHAQLKKRAPGLRLSCPLPALKPEQKGWRKEEITERIFKLTKTALLCRTWAPGGSFTFKDLLMMAKEEALTSKPRLAQVLDVCARVCMAWTWCSSRLNKNSKYLLSSTGDRT